MTATEAVQAPIVEKFAVTVTLLAEGATMKEAVDSLGAKLKAGDVLIVEGSYVNVNWINPNKKKRRRKSE